MSIFGDYARYYNLLYQDKEYAAETEFILECLTRYGGMPATLLDLGCGTGRHALEMARRGVCVTGVDMSATMLEMGRQLQAASPDLPAEILPPLLQEGDARTVRRISDNIVEVHYSIRLTDKATGSESSLSEVHSMRYWFLPELRHLARMTGFRPVAEGAWMRHDMLSGMPWNAWMLLEL